MTDTANPGSPFRKSPGYLAWAFDVQQGIEGSLTEAELRALQLQRLNTTLARARQRSRFYQQHLPIDRLGSLEELKTLPLMDAAAFAQGFEPLLCVDAQGISRIVTLPTSGTTGPPKRIAFTEADHARTVEYFTAGMRMLAAEGECIAVLYPCERPGGLGQLISEAVTKVPGRALPYGIPKSFSELAASCKEEQVRALVGFPQHLFAFARWCEHNSIELKLRAVLLSADHAGPTLTKEIERIWRVPVYNHFGMTEFAFGGAVECDQHKGCHIRETDLLFEVIDPDTGELLPDGTWGELVFTTINQQAMPFIRYRTGDRARLLPGACRCGSALKRIDRVRGRLCDTVGLERWSFGMPELEDALFTLPGIMDFKAEFSDTCLILDVFVQVLEGNPVDEETVADLLWGTEPFAKLHEDGLLQLYVQVEQVTDFSPLYPGKRSLL
ncbi:MAG: AMP-binding protein [Coriobacteriia bacterium]|nr:AMP-binding protein [Coriobacteriia bacterium]